MSYLFRKCTFCVWSWWVPSIFGISSPFLKEYALPLTDCHVKHTYLKVIVLKICGKVSDTNYLNVNFFQSLMLDGCCCGASKQVITDFILKRYQMGRARPYKPATVSG